MKITIQSQDYTTALDAAHPVVIERRLNEPSVCELWLSLPANGSLAAPVRCQSLTVSGDDGTIYFTGYIAANPLPEYAGVALEGPRCRTAIHALSDELLLDQLFMPRSAGMTGKTAGQLLESLVTHSGSTALSTHGLTLNTAIANFVPEHGADWSKSAGQIASMARAAYRATSGALSLASVQTAVHPLDETDGTLTLSNLTFTAGLRHALANDITVCGENEPVAYVTEYFLGDGATTQFYLAADPFFPAASRSTIISELFSEPQINQSLWAVSGGPGYLALGAGGLVMNGGNGIDGQTMLTWLDPVEMGGTLLLEALGVSLSSGSTGILAGLFTGLLTAAGCIAGLQITAATGPGAVTVQPLIEGIPNGSTFTINSANQYTLRVRVNCPECQRACAMYYSLGDSGVISAGGEWVASPGKVQIEIQEFVGGVGATPVTLYEGVIATLPGACTVVAASSINLVGVLRAFHLTNLGSGWVVSTPPGGGPYTRRLGATSEAAECYLDRTGKLVFYTGYAPVSGEQIAVSYRTIGRAVGRAVNAASQTLLAAAGLPSIAVWIGSVTSPPARCSADCRAAARVLAEAAASVSALWSGAYKGTRASFASDVWPGDALLLNAPSAGIDAQVVIRTVKVTYSPSYPDFVQYEITFANDWADDLAIKTSGAVPANAWLPAPIAPTVLANLNALTVTSLSGSSVTIDTRTTPPPGGGFEVRLRDFAFMAGEDPTLVLRSSSSALTFSRVSAADRFYIRMYDGSTPPNYSEFSMALFINLPLSV
ncbi:MAG TPA: hypothetical protein VHD85_17735 [Terracidiphilus sp.]|nr:hypothetical protein [Terracidiphilus sp.]